ncbi:heavy metal-associated isoprenylated plant protein 2-like [Amaranthus tricolor]|uniref:heavy metal-associated isoprenylated plant protein 2-like n=1 Tax=Amaranthus tricolor TaxID=29722 RepID=UPI00258B58CD|nr:heavy metal-associated isoprenylated plant protein 2-like [Amaranthus tricolor]
MVHKTVLKVDLSCDKCKKELFGIVSKLEGVNKIEADSEKGTIAVIGDADPYNIVTCIRKAGKKAHIVTIGPPPKPEEKKPEEKCKELAKLCTCLYPAHCWGCRTIPIMTMEYEDPTPPCSIM